MATLAQWNMGQAYTGIADRERVETLATELVAATREAPITEVQR